MATMTEYKCPCCGGAIEFDTHSQNMKCPFCSSENTRVIDSRPADDNNSIRRRRLCDDCGKRFTTYEKVETIPLIVIKKDNIREQYDRAKIEGGVLRACHKRPISVDQISKLIDEVETEIFNREDKEIPSSVIGEILMDKLKDLDSVAYVRFASVYREFKDVNTFMNELKKMKINKIALIAFTKNDAGNAFWKQIGWTCRPDCNYYEFILNEANITRFIENETEE